MGAVHDLVQRTARLHQLRHQRGGALPRDAAAPHRLLDQPGGETLRVLRAGRALVGGRALQLAEVVEDALELVHQLVTHAAATGGCGGGRATVTGREGGFADEARMVPRAGGAGPAPKRHAPRAVEPLSGAKSQQGQSGACERSERFRRPFAHCWLPVSPTVPRAHGPCCTLTAALIIR